MMKMHYDEYEKIYEGGDMTKQIDFIEDIDLIEKDTKWITMPLRGMNVKNIIGPLFAEQLLKDYNIYGNDLDALLSTVTDGSAMGYVKGSQFMVGTIENGKSIYYLLSQTGFLQLVQLIGSSCPAFFRRTNDKREKDLNYDLSTVGDKEIQVQVVGGKIQTAHSSSYVILKKNKMLYGIVDILDEKYPDYEFRGGYYSHAGIYAKWAFPAQAEEILGLYEEAIDKKAGTHKAIFEDAVPVMRFYTSDVGESSASLGAYLEANGIFIKIGNLVKTYHKGNSTEQDVIDACEGMFAQFRDLVAAMAKLVDIKIKHPINTMLNIGLSVCNLHRIQLLKAVEEYKDMYGEDEAGTADDVFFVLQRALNNMRIAGKATDQKIEDCEEALLKLVAPSFAWDAYDTTVLTVNAGASE